VAELRSAQPFVEIRLYKNFAFAMASVVVFLNTMTFMATNFVVTLFLQIHLGYTPLQAAWILLPSAVVIGVLGVGTGRLSDLVAPRVLVIFGLVVVVFCLLQHTTITTLTSLEAITFWFTVRGFARAFTIAPLSRGSLATLPEAQLRMGSGLLSLNRGIASAGSVALAATVFQNRLAERGLRLAQDQSAWPVGAEELLQNLLVTFKHLGDVTQIAEAKALTMLQQLIGAEAALHSYHDTFIIIAGLSAIGILPALWMGNPKAQAAASVQPTAPPQATAPQPQAVPSVAAAVGVASGPSVEPQTPHSVKSPPVPAPGS